MWGDPSELDSQLFFWIGDLHDDFARAVDWIWLAQWLGNAGFRLGALAWGPNDFIANRCHDRFLLAVGGVEPLVSCCNCSKRHFAGGVDAGRIELDTVLVYRCLVQAEFIVRFVAAVFCDRVW